ncbi:MAG: magnesium and cobalt transport protein CorA [Chloroflexi bacterium GWB2_54_36]|nr:MAG: magnesium and cobalt transport protein CorA [Chloroflexi bacterium GWB2_54_36]
MIHTLYIPKSGTPQWDISPTALASAVADTDGLVWVSLEQPTAEETRAVLTDLFHFHPLAVEDTESTGFQTPKVDDYGTYLFIVVMALSADHDHSLLNSAEFDIFLGQNYVVSSYYAPQLEAVEKLRRRLQRDERLQTNGADFLCHALIDIIVDDYSPPLEELEDELEALEDLILDKPQPETLQKLLRLKHAIISVRRVIAPQREVINHLTREEFSMIDRQSQIYFRDIYDHLVRVYDWIDILRDMATNALEAYLNSTSLRLNEVMKALTIVSTIFLPLTFVAGIYGMNFHFMPELSWKYGYPMVWIVFLLIAGWMVYYFRKRKWF